MSWDIGPIKHHPRRTDTNVRPLLLEILRRISESEEQQRANRQHVMEEMAKQIDAELTTQDQQTTDIEHEVIETKLNNP